MTLQEAGKTVNQAKNDSMYAEPSNKDQFPEAVEEEYNSENDMWLSMARDANTTSQNYFDSSIRSNLERNIAHFGGRHAPGSKYYTDAYKFRAKGFRPKTRAVIRRSEAKMAIALFSTSDAVSITAENDNQEEFKVSAEILNEIINYRMENTIRWYQIAMGAFQDTQVAGICISHQYWDFDEIRIEEPLDDEYGPVFDEDGSVATGTRRITVTDTPKIELRPVENVRFSPDCSWEDPVGTSAYLIDQIPMQVGEIKKMAERKEKSLLSWSMPSDAQLMAGGLTNDHDPVRQQREGKREDSKDQKHSIHDFDVVWVHRNIIKKDGIDWVFYTLGDYMMLTNVVALVDEYPHLKPGQRPYTCGTSIIETHKSYPESQAGLVANLQQEANDVGNQRRDNVQLAMNRRYFARRGANINYSNLTRSVPGGVVEMDNIANDIRSEAPPDVTGSSYQEQERINLDFDDLAGSFSSSSVGTNRNLNETVGGMEIMAADADDVTEYSLKTFSETWIKPTLKQIIQLEQRFESDQAILEMVGDKLKLWQRYRKAEVTDQMLQGSMTVQINVGFGATNPVKRIDKLLKGVGAVMSLNPSMQYRLDVDEVSSEIFGALGYSGADRFFKSEEEVQAPEPEQDPRIQVEMIREEGRNLQREHEQMMLMAKNESAQSLKLIDARMKQMALELTSNLEIMKRDGASQEHIDGIKSEFAKLVMKIQSTERLVAKKANASELPRPPVEPPGRARAGESYTA